MQKPKYHVFVCSSSRVTGQQKGYCFSKDSVSVIQKFMEEIEEREMGGDILVTNTGCLGICSKGPVVIVYPDGVWYKEVTVDDVSEIVEEHLENGRVVSRLEIK
ncbi:2Fe-2S ferredoxin [Pseudobacteroides cellulosolvens]|uniref:NADH dehydrogenase (Ubiquinone) 24 kDa subunit n=1 Tax=Pseudobacteroides cellulosolvens ATCC 35603 = DSM 2933 TaxID=398512 RepID=A0A0L6JWE9_9FIRM|nr:2Fe-2S ferredoxin [Pseudobacteroides cellulosolvens]KNY30059.1 NADH dehydrogenase (ubiquinone) 24 kDa subunit [Pseudobacteroides cellulosolvens ATCC 35603 = DSM 2933]